MTRLLIFVLPVLWGLAMWYFSARRTGKHLDAQSTELADPRLAPHLERLATALDIPRIRVFVYEVAQLNGLAAPDKRIFITRGFLNALNAGQVTAEEITSVISHELGHVALGHSRRRMIDFGGQTALNMVLVPLLARFIPFIGPIVANTLIRALAARLSRSDEYEADAYATALLIKSGLGIEPQISLFEKLDSLSGKNGSSATWLQSHPDTHDRIKAIRANADRWLS